MPAPFNTRTELGSKLLAPATQGAWLAGEIRDDTPTGGTPQRVKCMFVFIGLDQSSSQTVPVVGMEEVSLSAGVGGVLSSGEQSVGSHGNRIFVP